VQPTSTPNSIVVESCHSDWKPGPLISLDPRIGIDDVEILVHPQLVCKVAHEDSPVLRRVGVLVRLLSDQFPQPSFLGEPFPSEAANGVPANFDGARDSIRDGMGQRDDVGGLTEANGVFEGEFTLVVAFLSGVV